MIVPDSDSPMYNNYPLMLQALTNRAMAVRVLPRPLAPSSPYEGLSTPSTQTVLLCIKADAAAALRLVDIGPPADDAAAAKAFRDFWGDKAELRRFQVGWRPQLHDQGKGAIPEE